MILPVVTLGPLADARAEPTAVRSAPICPLTATCDAATLLAAAPAATSARFALPTMALTLLEVTGVISLIAVLSVEPG
jgi:hypothetical protein